MNGTLFSVEAKSSLSLSEETFRHLAISRIIFMILGHTFYIRISRKDIDMTNTSFYFSPSHTKSYSKFCRTLQNMIPTSGKRQIVFLCIGSDRATGDSLGPIVGQQLAWALGHHEKAVVYGSLHQTVHAGNLAETLAKIHNRYHHPFIIAIDASLGIPEHIGYVTLGSGHLRPGIGVSHQLPEAGDIHITGIVNHSTGNNHLTLQTTKLFTVMELSGFIANGILEALHVRPALQRPQESHFVNIF